jgi:aspartate racemase
VILLCTNTMHRVADAIERAVSVTFVHIADATGMAIDRAGIATVGLLGTRYTMDDGFYPDRLQQGRDLRVIVPTSEDRDPVHRVIYDELVRGELSPRSRQAYIEGKELALEAF